MALLEVKELVKTYGGRTVLDGVSFDLEEGEAKVVMGPSGCGKSTLAALPQPAHRTDFGSDPARRQGRHAPGCRRPRGAQPHRLRFPEFRALPAHVGAGQCDARPAPVEEDPEARGGGARAARARSHGDGGKARRVSGGAFRRAEPAGRDRARAGDGSEGPVLRRADLRARSDHGPRGRDADQSPLPRQCRRSFASPTISASRSIFPTGSCFSIGARSTPRIGSKTCSHRDDPVIEDFFGGEG